MNEQQILLFLVFGGILVFLLWGRFRYDLVAAGGLLIAVLVGLVPADATFSGFANPAVVIVALVLVASRAFENSGVLSLLTRPLVRNGRSIMAHIAVTGGIGAALSTVINNVAALALLMPLDIKAARQAGRPPSQTLMPLAFATILGGMVTLIGTPPNIIASAIRAERMGEPYGMFDFAPVGLAVSIAGIGFVALVGWRLIPRRADPAGAIAEKASFKAELQVPQGSEIVGKVLAELDEAAEREDLLIHGIVRGATRSHGRARAMTIQADDILLVEGATDAIAAFIKLYGLHNMAADSAQEATGSPADDKSRVSAPSIVDAVVRTDSRLAGRSAVELDLRARYGITLLGISRNGAFVADEVRRRKIQPGDMLLIAGSGALRQSNLELLGLMPVSESTPVGATNLPRMLLTVGLFAAAVAVSAWGWLPFAVALAMAIAGYAAFAIVPAREFYGQIEWPVIVMLACLLPIGAAFERLGGTALMADAILQATRGQAPVVALLIMMVAIMMLSDVLNNVATMVIAGPLAIELANGLSVNPDTFLMGAAIATSCAFLTPIGHKNNTLIMGPGGYRFADYWPMGVPLELIVLVVGTPVLLIVWPL